MSSNFEPDGFQSLAPVGYYLAVRIGFAFPMIEVNNLPDSWVREYTVSGLVVQDPAMSWAYRNCGITRWSELVEDDTLGVLEMAKNHNLNYGAVASYVDDGDSGQRSIGIFCRSEREYLADELDELNRALVAAHQAHAHPKNLTKAELEALSLVKNGLLMKEIACLLGVTESAVKQRLKKARLKLDAKNGPQAAARATMLGMI